MLQAVKNVIYEVFYVAHANIIGFQNVNCNLFDNKSGGEMRFKLKKFRHLMRNSIFSNPRSMLQI